MANRQYDPETKAAVMAALLAGQSVDSVAGDYRLPVGTVKSWKARAKPVAAVDPQKASEIGDLLLDYLRSNLAALKAQATLFADPKWLQRQNAHEIGVLHGIMTDKAVRLLEAFGRADDSVTHTAD